MENREHPPRAVPIGWGHHRPLFLEGDDTLPHLVEPTVEPIIEQRAVTSLREHSAQATLIDVIENRLRVVIAESPDLEDADAPLASE